MFHSSYVKLPEGTTKFAALETLGLSHEFLPPIMTPAAIMIPIDKYFLVCGNQESWLNSIFLSNSDQFNHVKSQFLELQWHLLRLYLWLVLGAKSTFSEGIWCTRQCFTFVFSFFNHYFQQFSAEGYLLLFFFRGRFCFFWGVPGSMLSCFSDFLLLCFSCFSAVLLLCFLLSLLLCFSCFSAFCFSCFFLFLLLCFPCFSAFVLLCLSTSTSSTAQGGGGSFKNRKPIGRVGCCESRMAERSH